MTRVFSLIVIFLVGFTASATHNAGGEITYKHISGLTYEITIHTITDISNPQNADRHFMLIDWGHLDPDGEFIQDSIARSAEVILVPNQIKENYYTKEHTFPGLGSYDLNSIDPNRNDGINNIPGSVNTVLSLRSRLIITDEQVGNDSPFFYSHPNLHQLGINDELMWSNTASDLNGDSLAIELIPCASYLDSVVMGYEFPDDFPEVGDNGDLFLDIDGNLIWTDIQHSGLYALCVRISEYRFGEVIGFVEREIQLKVEVSPLVIDLVASVDLPACVPPDHVGSFQYQYSFSSEVDEVVFEGVIFDEDLATVEQLDQNSGLIHIDLDNSLYGQQYIHIKALRDGVTVASYSTSFKISGSSIVSLNELVDECGTMRLSWDLLEAVSPAGIEIYRRMDGESVDPVACRYGNPDDLTYEVIPAEVDSQESTWVDETITTGDSACYRIGLVFQDGSRGVASDEVCGRCNSNADDCAQTNVYIAPNPADGYIQFQGNEENLLLSYQVTRTTGELLYTGEFDSSSFLISGVEPGIYIVTILGVQNPFSIIVGIL